MPSTKYSTSEVVLSNTECNTDIVEDKHTSDILNCDDIICFVVGGTRFQIMKSKFAYWPQTRLSKLIRAKSEIERRKLCDKVVVSIERKCVAQINRTYHFTVSVMKS